MSVEYKQLIDPVKLISVTRDKANLENAIAAVGLAKSLAHVETGQHRNSMGWKTKDDSGGYEGGESEISDSFKDGEIGIGATSDHSIYDEFGTRFMAPQPALRPAVDRYFNETAIADVMKKVTEEVAKGPLVKGQIRETFGV